MSEKKKIEVCLSTTLFRHYFSNDTVVVVADILRATTAICTAFKNGAKKLIPVATVDEARKYKEKGYLVAAEREGVKLDFADFGNSPFNFTPQNVEGETIVYSTTNGTHAIEISKKAPVVVVGSFVNLTAVTDWLIDRGMPVTVLCSGRKGRFCLEDAVFAGAITSGLLDSGKYFSNCDSAFAAKELWRRAKNNISGYLENAEQRHRLKSKGLDDIFEYTCTPDTATVVPVLLNGRLVDVNSELIGKEV